VARIQLSLDKCDEARKMLDEASKALDSLPSVDPLVQAAFYDVNAEYHKSRAEYTDYYRNALLYLACINIDDLSRVQQQARAFDLAVAALLGEKTYNFGELLLHPILDTLVDTEWAWLVDFLRALNAGDVKQFELLSAEHLHKQPLLQGSLPFLKQKICLAALIEAVFRRPTSSRTLTFATIAAETHLPQDEVEIMVMKALSLGLLKGFIDQVSSTVTVTWIQPRVMNLDQIKSMRDRLVKWDSEVKNLGDWIHDAGSEIWTRA
jgi:26S proteasome regulatory subunit N9